MYTANVQTESTLWYWFYHLVEETLVGQNTGEYGELLANRQRFLPQIYGIFNIYVLVIY